MLQDVSGGGTWSKTCFKMSLAGALGVRHASRMSVAEALGARNASTCLWQRHLEQDMLQDVSGRGTWSKKCFRMCLVEALGAKNASMSLAGH